MEMLEMEKKKNAAFNNSSKIVFDFKKPGKNPCGDP